ncbi:hypothetical protein MKX62_15120 [Sporosarcina sp. FSL K6-5500]
MDTLKKEIIASYILVGLEKRKKKEIMILTKLSTLITLISITSQYSRKHYW